MLSHPKVRVEVCCRLRAQTRPARARERWAASSDLACCGKAVHTGADAHGWPTFHCGDRNRAQDAPQGRPRALRRWYCWMLLACCRAISLSNALAAAGLAGRPCFPPAPAWPRCVRPRCGAGTDGAHSDRPARQLAHRLTERPACLRCPRSAWSLYRAQTRAQTMAGPALKRLEKIRCRRCTNPSAGFGSVTGFYVG